ncbi:MAG: acetylxylan esterase [Planctomycetota bacterium]|nr:acetylxylan esterase [Planctomycetota bacterium]
MAPEQLRLYRPSLYRPDDFEAFWEQTVSKAINQPLNAELIPYDLPARGVECFAIRFDGFDGGRLAGWFLRPERAGKYPGVCMFHGYSGRAPRPLDMLPYAAQGMCVLSMDCRGQNGQSQDTATYPEGHYLGWMTAGIRDHRTYYYRYVYADAVRALEVLAHREEVDNRRIAVTGASQGGGLCLVAAALSDRVTLALADIPFLCDFRRAITITPVGPYPEISSFIKAHPQLYDQVIHTLSYFDCLNLAPKIRCKTVISSSLWDDVCPPSTIYAVFNHINAEKHLEVFPFHKHETPYEHQEQKFRLLTEMLHTEQGHVA